MRWLLGLLASLSFEIAAAEKFTLVNPAAYTGMADASGAVPICSNLLAVADDEDNILRIYRSDQPGPPLKQFDLNSFLQVHGKSLEADLEAAARIGDRAYWMGSHGRNKKGKERPNRGCFFATDIKVSGNDIALVPVGEPYNDLLTDLVSDPQLAPLHLGEASALAPKERGALNIEGLAATPEGQLLIGFRNPVPDGKALLVPMLNPAQVIAGTRARFGPPIQLDLDGLGIRDIALFEHTYIIIGGSYHGGGKFELFQWQGPGSTPERLKVKHLNQYHPEALIIYPEKGLREFQVLSDDGTEPVDGVPGKEVKNPAHKTFRSFWVKESD